MGRSLLLLFIRQVLTGLFLGIGYTAIMLIITMFAVFRGIWQQSDYVANGWRSQMRIARWDDRLNGPMYWSIRIIAFVLMLICLVVLAHVLTWLVERALLM